MGPKKAKTVEEPPVEEDEEEDDYGEEDEDEKGPVSKRPQWHHWSDYFVGIDMFGATPALEVRGKRKIKSVCGAFVSILVVLLVFVYIAYKLSYYNVFAALRPLF